MLLENFIRHYPPGDHLTPPDNEALAQYIDILPDALTELWRLYGLGKYAKGLIEIIHPNDYKDTLYTWLGKWDPTRIPIALSAFGELFYYRKLTDKDEDVSELNPHYRKIKVCTWELEEFFNEYLCLKNIIEKLSHKQLFEEAKQKLGILPANEIYYFVPALAWGGLEQIQHVQKGDAQVHLEFLFQLG